MISIELRDVVFLCAALLTTVPCLITAFSRNILYSAFSLFFTLLGTSGLYFFINAEFLAIVQIVVYIGGITVLLLFAILLTKNIGEIQKTNAVKASRAFIAGALAVVSIGAIIFAMVRDKESFRHGASAGYPFLTMDAIGELLMNKYLLPFETASLLLLAVLIGSLVIAKRAVK